VAEELYDPVNRFWVHFTREGDDLTIHTRVEPGGGPPPHKHPNGDEIFTVASGRVEFLRGRSKVIAGPGEEVVVPAGTRHAFKNVGDEQAVFEAVVRPEKTGKGEAFFEEVVAAAKAGKFTQRGLPRGPRAAMELMAMLERYQDFVLILNPPPAVQRLIFPIARRFAN
jgi:quercetin dioxygenase-like cupin family protein